MRRTNRRPVTLQYATAVIRDLKLARRRGVSERLGAADFVSFFSAALEGVSVDLGMKIIILR